MEDPRSLSQIHKEEVTIIEGALKFREMLVRDIMTPVRDMFTLRADQRLDYQV
jgi:CBS domain containing-hemolysin-like protein